MPSFSHFVAQPGYLNFRKLAEQKRIYKLELVQKKQMFKNIYMPTNLSTQYISVFITPYFYTLFSVFRLLHCLEKKYILVLEICQKILIRFLLLFLQLQPNGSNFTTLFLLHFESRKQVWPTLLFEDWLLSEKKTISLSAVIAYLFQSYRKCLRTSINYL